MSVIVTIASAARRTDFPLTLDRLCSSPPYAAVFCTNGVDVYPIGARSPFLDGPGGWFGHPEGAGMLSLLAGNFSGIHEDRK
jgi:hypothetical protein